MSRESSRYRIAIVGASSLRGKELKQVVEDRNFPASEIALLDTSVPVGTLAEAAGEPTFIKPMDRESFAGARFVFFAGSADETRDNWKLAHDSGATIIDLTGTLDETAHAAAWIPELDTLLAPPEHKIRKHQGSGIFSSPAPAVIIACTLAAVLRKFSPMRLAILFFPPVSERGQLGVEELEKQTADLLLLRPITQAIFDTQVAFNLLAGYGETSRPSLVEMRKEIARGAASYLDGRIPIPAMQLIQAPVFYGYAFAAYAEFAEAHESAKLNSALAGAGIHLVSEDEPKPTNISVAGEGKIHLARAERDEKVSGGVWLWGVTDNLQLAGTNAVRIAEELLAPKI
ncbi:MAG TPA: Asd/ArgC dimerization domain-containing protein [Candidatus Acidoferrales bacterium]|nr:Asd/ArgC dimerization domain-containing protein [Candidatus Acidoferrales bacterium]